MSFKLSTAWDWSGSIKSVMISVGCIKINKVTSLGFRSLSEVSFSCLEVLCIIFLGYNAYNA